MIKLNSYPAVKLNSLYAMSDYCFTMKMSSDYSGYFSGAGEKNRGRGMVAAWLMQGDVTTG